MAMYFEAEGDKVFRVLDGDRQPVCEVSKIMLVPSHVAEQIADAMNAKFQVK